MCAGYNTDCAFVYNTIVCVMIEVSSADIRFLGSEGYRLVIKMNGRL